jgi:hypothetical protein
MEPVIGIAGNTVPDQEDLFPWLYDPLKAGLPAHFTRFTIILDETVKGNIRIEHHIQIQTVDGSDETTFREFYITPD